MTTKTLIAFTLLLASGTTALSAQTTTTPPQQDTTKSEKIFSVVDQQAQPKKGMQRFLKYLSEHVSYPKAARENNIEGTVIVRFVVNRDGSLSDFKIIKEIGGGCGETVTKALEKYSKRWTPGFDNGKPVRTYYLLPFTFSLQ